MKNEVLGSTLNVDNDLLNGSQVHKYIFKFEMYILIIKPLQDIYKFRDKNPKYIFILTPTMVSSTFMILSWIPSICA